LRHCLVNRAQKKMAPPERIRAAGPLARTARPRKRPKRKEVKEVKEVKKKKVGRDRLVDVGEVGDGSATGGASPAPTG